MRRDHETGLGTAVSLMFILSLVMASAFIFGFSFVCMLIGGALGFTFGYWWYVAGAIVIILLKSILGRGK